MTKQLQDLVPDLSICQEAKEKGVKIESWFYWVQSCEGSDIWVIKKTIGVPGCGYYPAPLTDEILEVIKSKNKADSLEIVKKKDYYEAYFWDDINTTWIGFEDKKLSNALLKLAIRLKEEGII